MKLFQGFVQFAESLESAKGANAKKAVLRGASQMDLGFLKATYDPFVTYGIAEFKPPKVPVAAITPDDAQFQRILNLLAARELSGNTARLAVDRLLAGMSETEGKWFRRLLTKNLRAGVTAVTINAVHPGLIPDFPLALAAKYTGDYSDIEYPVQFEYKWDGYRTVVFCCGPDEPTLYRSREGLEFDHIGTLFDEELHELYKVIGRPFIIDGELMSRDYQATASARGKSADRSQMRLVAFDIHDMGNWDDRYCVTTQEERTDYLASLIRQLPMEKPKLQMSYYERIHSAQEAEAFYARAVHDRLEGVVIKRLKAFYEWCRSDNWLKVKPVNTYDGVITEIIPGKADSQYADTVGAIRVEGQDENGTPFDVNIGSGIDDDFRAQLKERPNDFLSHHIELKADAMTKPLKGTVHSLRFPRISKMRPDLD